MAAPLWPLSQKVRRLTVSHAHKAVPNLKVTIRADGSPIAMVDPADRTYPTNVTSTYSTTRTDTAAVTVDHVTAIDAWTISPDPESVPYTMTETQITERTIFPSAAAPTTTHITATSTWMLWTISTLDMPPYAPIVCPGPGGCSPQSIKPNTRCLELGLETRCAAQCLLKDWMWWCTRHVGGEDGALMGRVCAGNNSTDYEEILEPCDHTDFKPGCQLCPEDEGKGEV
jgi:hypothetical protein